LGFYKESFLEEVRELVQYFTMMDSPVDKIFITCENSNITGVFIGEDDFFEWKNRIGENIFRNDEEQILKEACVQLNEYFQKKRKKFDLPLILKGTKFQQSVWNALLHIPYGETRPYLYIAESIGNEKAVRAVGQANRANHIPIIIPCHRVIGRDGKLLGYAGSRTEIKEFLLHLEGAIT